jgi:hypothetical protein
MKASKRSTWPAAALLLLAVFLLVSSVAFAGNGPGGPGGPGGTKPTDGGEPQGSESDTGSLYGDLYVILRHLDTTADHTGGEPMLSTEPGWEIIETTPEGSEVVEYEVRLAEDAAGAPIPSNCVQPVADWNRWGDIWHPNDLGYPEHQVAVEGGGFEWVPITGPSAYETGLDMNRLPLVLTYDATWGRTEGELGLLLETPTANDDGTMNLVIDPYFIQPGGTWEDSVNGVVTYPDGVLWADMVQEVGFGRMNVSRAPEAVRLAAFDEAINAINSPDTIAIEIDAAGRLLLTKNVYSEYEVDPATGDPILIGTTKKAIDSPLENMALLVKLMQDGHLVTPADEREPIDRSPLGGMPDWMSVLLEDGPSEALRPTIDIAKMQAWGLGHLVDVTPVDYYAYYTDPGSSTTTTHKGKPNQEDPALPAYVVETTYTGAPPAPPLFTGILTDDGGSPDGADFRFAASFFAAAADKSGHISVDMVVYLNSIYGLNLVVGENADNPVYFDFSGVDPYGDTGRSGDIGARGELSSQGGNGSASTYTGQVNVLQGTSPTWTETLVNLIGGPIGYEGLGQDPTTHFPTKAVANSDILAFTQMADDNLSVIEFIHTYQIPERR